MDNWADLTGSFKEDVRSISLVDLKSWQGISRSQGIRSEAA